jgi:hypothetical protein
MTCLEYHAFKAQGGRERYWNTPQGMIRRIDHLGQAFIYRFINNAAKVVGNTNQIEWMFWEDYGDSKVCEICLGYAMGGEDHSGFYRVTWFMPVMPVHDGCRCKWVLVPRSEQVTFER